MNEFFDAIYCINLSRREERMRISDKRHAFSGLKVQRFNAIDGQIFDYIWTKLDNPVFKNKYYLACQLSHLLIYQEAIDKGYERILILEDDNRIHRNIDGVFDTFVKQLPSKTDWDLLHFAYIPLTDDLSSWDYNILNENFLSPHVIKSKNMWSLMAYGISKRMMEELLYVYKTSFPMELDRYFVDIVFKNPHKKCYAISPQIFCAEDNMSDNTNTYTPGLFQKSVDTRYANYHDYV